MEIKSANQLLTNASKAYTENPILRMITNLIPTIGGSLDIAFSEKWNKINNSRIEVFMTSLTEDLSDIKENFVNKDFIESEDFANLYKTCLTSSIKTRHHERILLFARILKGAMTSDKFDMDEFEEILPTLEIVSERELMLLNHLDIWETNLTNNYLKMLEYSEVRTGSTISNFEGIPVYSGFWDAFTKELETNYNLSTENVEYLLQTASQKGLFTFTRYDVSKQNNKEDMYILAGRDSFQHTMEGKLTPLYKRMKKYILTQNKEI